MIYILVLMNIFLSIKINAGDSADMLNKSGYFCFENIDDCPFEQNFLSTLENTCDHVALASDVNDAHKNAYSAMFILSYLKDDDQNIIISPHAPDHRYKTRVPLTPKDCEILDHAARTILELIPKDRWQKKAQAVLLFFDELRKIQEQKESYSSDLAIESLRWHCDIFGSKEEYNYEFLFMVIMQSKDLSNHDLQIAWAEKKALLCPSPEAFHYTDDPNIEIIKSISCVRGSGYIVDQHREEEKKVIVHRHNGYIANSTQGCRKKLVIRFKLS
jgi:hypothetical protein